MIREYVPKPEEVSRQLAPGLWIDHQNQMHCCAVTVLKSKGLPVTEENIEVVEEQLALIVREKYPKAKIVTLFPGGESTVEGSE